MKTNKNPQKEYFEKYIKDKMIVEEDYNYIKRVKNSPRRYFLSQYKPHWKYNDPFRYIRLGYDDKGEDIMLKVYYVNILDTEVELPWGWQIQFIIALDPTKLYKNKLYEKESLETLLNNLEATGIKEITNEIESYKIRKWKEKENENEENEDEEESNI